MNNPDNASGFPSGSDSNSLPALFLSFQEFYVLFSQEAICKMFLILRPRVEVYDKILSFANRVGLTVTLYPWIFNDNLIEFYGVFAVWSSKTLYPTITKNTFFYPILLPNCGSREIFLINFKPIEEFNLFQKLY